MNTGKNLENLIERINHDYRREKTAFLFRGETSARIENGGVRLLKSTPDFVGILNTGKAIAFDAKTTTLNYFPKSNIKEHQINFLSLYEELGGIGAILLWTTTNDSYYFIPISFIVNHERNKIEFSEISQYKIIDVEHYLDASGS